MEALACDCPPSIYTLLYKSQLSWADHTFQMLDGGIPKKLSYGELKDGKWPMGRLKETMKTSSITIAKWEVLASDWSA